VGLWRALYTAGLIDGARVAQYVLGWYQGRSEAELRERTAEWFQRDVLPLVSERGRRALEEHRARGDALILVTASPQFVAELVAAELDIPHVVCTVVEVRDGVLTGRLEGPLCFGPGKLEKLAATLLRLPGGSGELSSATLYTDSITDLPLLEAVRFPVAVNPDFRLRTLARRRGWPIRQW